MAYPAIALACLAAVLVALPGDALFLAMGAAILAIALGRSVYRRRSSPGSHRLWGAAATGLGGVVLALCAVRYGVIVAALGRMDALIG